MLPFCNLLDVVAVLDVVKRIYWLEFLLIKIVFVEVKLLTVVLMISDYRFKHIDNFCGLKVNRILVFDENSQINLVHKVLELQPLVVLVDALYYLELLIILDVVRSQAHGNDAEDIELIQLSGSDVEVVDEPLRHYDGVDHVRHSC